MRLILIALFLSGISARSQKRVEEFGYRHIQYTYNGVPSDVVIASKEGEESRSKPLFLFFQGSLPIPLIIYDSTGATGLFPFDEKILTDQFHLAIIGKPGIPLTGEFGKLRIDGTYVDSTGSFPLSYVQNNYLDFYVKRNSYIISQLLKRSEFDKSQLVVAGHSEGATVAAKLAQTDKRVTHLIYASGNPMGRIMSMLQRSREHENDSIPLAAADFDYWTYLNETNQDKDSIDYYAQTDYSFSIEPMEYLKKLKIPVLVSYGTKDYCAPFNDYLHLWCIANRKYNFAFHDYIGLEHNFFGTDSAGKINYDDFNWHDVAQDWKSWINQNQP